MLSIRFDWKNVSPVSYCDQLFLIDGLKIFSMEKSFEHPLRPFSDHGQAMSYIQKGLARSVKNFAFYINGLKDLLLQCFLGRKSKDFFRKSGGLDMLQLLEESPESFAQNNLLINIQ